MSIFDIPDGDVAIISFSHFSFHFDWDLKKTANRATGNVSFNFIIFTNEFCLSVLSIAQITGWS